MSKSLFVFVKGSISDETIELIKESNFIPVEITTLASYRIVDDLTKLSADDVTISAIQALDAGLSDAPTTAFGLSIRERLKAKLNIE